MDGTDAVNPYAPPQAPLASGAAAPDADDALPPWRLEGRTLFARNGARLPDICLFTGESTTPPERVRLALSWTPGWFRMIAVIAPLLAVFAYGFARRTCDLEVGLSRPGRRRRRLALLLALGAGASGVGLYTVVAERSADLSGAGTGDDLMALLMMAALAILIPWALTARVFRVAKIDRRYAQLRLREPVAAAFARLPPPGPAPR